jgi:hypothetical protein
MLHLPCADLLRKTRRGALDEFETLRQNALAPIRIRRTEQFGQASPGAAFEFAIASTPMMGLILGANSLEHRDAAVRAKLRH